MDAAQNISKLWTKIEKTFVRLLLSTRKFQDRIQRLPKFHFFFRTFLFIESFKNVI